MRCRRVARDRPATSERTATASYLHGQRRALAAYHAAEIAARACARPRSALAFARRSGIANPTRWRRRSLAFGHGAWSDGRPGWQRSRALDESIAMLVHAGSDRTPTSVARCRSQPALIALATVASTASARVISARDRIENTTPVTGAW